MASRGYTLVFRWVLGLAVVMLCGIVYLIKDVPSLHEQQASYCEGQNASVDGKYLKFEELSVNALRVFKLAEPHYKIGVVQILLLKMPEMNALNRVLHAIALEVWIKKYKESELIEFYLNRVYLGVGCYGIDAAAKAYFKKDVSDLSLEETAEILAMIKSPSSYSIADNPEQNKKRAESLINQLQSASEHAAPKEQ